jgi:hypothetical protein
VDDAVSRIGKFMQPHAGLSDADALKHMEDALARALHRGGPRKKTRPGSMLKRKRKRAGKKPRTGIA